MVLLVTAGFTFNVWYALRPAYIEARLRHELHHYFGEPVAFRSLEFSLARGIEIDGLTVSSSRKEGASEREATPPVCEVGRLRVVPALLDAAFGRLRLEEVVLVEPVLRVSRGADGRWNIGPLLDLFGVDSEAVASDEESREDGTAGERPAAPLDLPAVRIEDGRIV